MPSYIELLRTIINKEKELQVYDEKIYGIPLWRLLRFSLRTKYVRERMLYNNNSKRKNVNLWPSIKGYFVSCLKYIRLFLRGDHIETLLFAFPRLTKFDNTYIDRFTDPLIDYSLISESYCVFQRNQAGDHKYPRYHASSVIESDFVDYTSKVLGVLLSPFFLLLHFRTINKLYRKAKIVFSLDRKFFLKSTLAIGTFKIYSLLITLVLKKLKPKNIMLVNRGVFIPLVATAKKLGVRVYELQHGVTHSETILYSGDYDELVDPHCFLVFGEIWKGPQFGVPVEKIINIGWGYKKMLDGVNKSNVLSDKNILVISAPSITSYMLKAVIYFSENFVDYNFHIRLHPQEDLSQEQLETIEPVPNIYIADNSIDSFIAIDRFTKIIGENSSVLYEALDMGKYVGRLRMQGLQPKSLNGKDLEGFFYIQGVEDLRQFLETDIGTTARCNNSMYDTFDEVAITNLIK